MLVVSLCRKLSVLTRIVGAVNGALLRASVTIGTEGGVPGVAVVAVGVSTDVVGPAPVGVKHDGSSLGGTAVATSASAGLPVDLGVSLSLRCADLLSADGAQEGERSEGERPVHLVC